MNDRVRDAFEIVEPAGASRAIVGHIPHASTHIPASVRSEILLDDAELADEVLRLTDSHTDELFAWLADHGATLFVNRLSRLVFDPERFLDEEQEPTEAVGQGVVYHRGTRGQELRRLTPKDRSARIEQLYRPYHAALDELTARIIAAHGSCLLIDCHSFPTRPLPSEPEQRTGRPDICIGTDTFHTPERLAGALEHAFAARGLDVWRNAPFAGTFVPGASLGRDARVTSVMIEVRRGLYMDEATGERLPRFGEVATAIEAALGDAGVLD